MGNNVSHLAIELFHGTAQNEPVLTGTLLCSECASALNYRSPLTLNDDEQGYVYAAARCFLTTGKECTLLFLGY